MVLRWSRGALGAGVLGLALCALTLQAQAGAWRDGRPMESARTQVQAAAVGGEVYVAGGISILGPRDDFEVYDPVADHWRALPALPKGSEMFGMAALGATIYVAGGITGQGTLSPSDDVWAFDTQTGQWRRAAALPAPRSGLVLAAARDSLFAIGGRGTGADRVLKLDGQDWVPFGAPLSPQRTGHAVAVNGDKIYVVGGQSGGGDLLSRVDIFNAATGQWSQGPSLPRAAMAATAAVIDGRLHVAGGMVPDKRQTLSDHYVMNLASGGWSKDAALPTARQGLASAAVGGEWFVVGGGSGSGAYTVFTASDAVEVFRP